MDFWQRVPQADVVLLIGAWRSWAIDRLPETMAALHLRTDQHIFVVGPKSFGEINIRQLLSVEPALRGSLRQEPAEEAVRLNQQLRDTIGAEQFVDVQTAACGNEGR